MTDPAPVSPRDNPSDWICDFNLLTALVALRAGYLNPEQFMAATHAWIDSNFEPVLSIVERLGFVTSDNQAALQAAVAEFIARRAPDLPRFSGPKSSAENDDGSNGRKTSVGDDDATKSMPARAPRFQVLSEHAKGGLGKVSIALDTELNRHVAFKEIKEDQLGVQAIHRRFVREAEITGQLEHPGVPPVYGFGQLDDGRPFYAMRFVHGKTFEQAIDEFHASHQSQRDKRESLRRLLTRFLSICDTLEFAHERGVIHRDLKPNNIMLGEHGETIVLDWGLARKQSPLPDRDKDLVFSDATDPRVSHPGALLGAPGYLSPEQALARWDKMDRRTDVFGLGATLYHLLAGHPPYQRDAEHDTLEKARQGAITPLDDLPAQIPKRLIEVCLTALAFEPADRYQNVTELREELWQWLSDEPLSALLAGVRHFEELTEKWPDIAQYPQRLARELCNLSKVYQSLERLDDARDAAQRAVYLLEQHRPRIQRIEVPWLQELYYSRAQLANLLRQAGADTEAQALEQSNKEELTSFAKLASQDPDLQEALVEITNHGGFEPEQANKLLRAYQEERERRPAPDADSDSTHTVTGSSHGWPESGSESHRAREADFPAEPDSATGTIGLPPSRGGEEHEAFMIASPSVRYRLLAAIGQGGLGIVYHAVDNLLGRTVALKTLKNDDISMRDFLKRESILTGGLNHEHVLPIYDAGHFGPQKQRPFFAMKLIQGENLATRAQAFRQQANRRQAFDPRLVRAISDAARALHSAHQQGIVHVDPKPTNILLDAQSKAWLIDWGIAIVFDRQRFCGARTEWYEEAEPQVRELVLSFRSEGTMIGTPLFMSPEHLRGQDLNPASDIFVLGCSLYVALTGERPRSIDGGAADLMRRIPSEPVPDPRIVVSKLPKKLAAICRRATALEPKDRFATAEEFAQALDVWAK